MKLAIADGVKLPLESVTQTFATLAKRGVGKSYLAAVLSEEMLKAGQLVVIIDPTGAHWGLRSSADGKRPGFPIVVLGGDHADVPLEEHAGEVVAAAIVEHRFPAILDLSLLRKGQSIRFMTAFLETLYRLNRQPLHLVVDEADTFAPQRLQGEEARMCGAMEDVVKKGRIRGLGCTLITQRPAVLNKNVLTQCESLFAMRMTHPKDIDAIKEWVGVHSDPAEADEVMKSLPSLEVGTAWLWSPGWLQMLKKIKVRRRETFDSSATPKPGERKIEPKHLASVDLAQLGAKIQSAADQAKANDPRELRRKIADLEKQLAAKAAPTPPKVERVEVPVLTENDFERIKRSAETLATALGRVETILETGKVREAVEALSAMQGKITAFRESGNSPKHRTLGHSPTHTGNRKSEKVFHPFTPKVKPAPAAGGSGSLPEGERKILVAIAQHADGVTREQLSILTGYKRSSRDTYLQRLKQRGCLQDDGRSIHATAEGMAQLPADFEALPTGDALRAHWLDRLPEGERRVFEVVCEAHPHTITRDAISEATDYKRSSRDTYLQRLKARKLVVDAGRGELRAADVLFG